MSLLWGLLFVASLGGVYFPIMLLTRLTRGGRGGRSSNDPRTARLPRRFYLT